MVVKAKTLVQSITFEGDGELLALSNLFACAAKWIETCGGVGNLAGISPLEANGMYRMLQDVGAALEGNGKMHEVGE